MKLDALKKKLLERPDIRAEYEAMAPSNVDRMNLGVASECLDASSMLGLLKHDGAR